MSEQKCISPLLDGFSMGPPMSEHDGVVCCPAIKENTEKKYIVKIISVPATQVQMDALLLAGAYKDPADAMEYFRQIGEGILKEAELLKKLSKLDGFLPYEGWQMEPITRRRLGYEIYLVGSYKRSLDKYMKKHPVTHLEAINLGLDLCAALTVSREAGALYVALKPSNIFVSDKKEYRICDLGFIPLNALSYTALPEKYQSAYTPRELFDPMASMNLTADTYAVGMILYQLYNDGQLPFKGKQAPEEVFPSPLNADYELAEIIMKAIHPDPSQRWDDPREMGKALAAYMQKNSVNDIPITPHIPLDVKPEDIVVIPKKKKKKNAQKDTVEEPAAEASEEAAEPVPPVESDMEAEPAEAVDLPEIIPESESSDAAAEESAEAALEEISAQPEENVAEDLADPKTVSPAEEPASEVSSDPIEEAVTETIIEQTDTLSEDTAEILENADDLIAYETPEDVLFPQAPEPEDPFAFVEEDMEELDDYALAEEPEEEPEEQPSAESGNVKKKKERKFQDPKYKRRKKRFIALLLFLLFAGMVSSAGYWYYQNLYLQTIASMEIDGDREQIVVTVDSAVEEGMLHATCTDSFGKTETAQLSNGQAVFTEISPNTMYTIELHIDGHHKLVGKTSDVYISDAATRIVSFTSVAGSEDGSVKLNFTVDGEEPNDWTVFYSAVGEEEKRKTFTGHSVDISGLTVGKVYTFRLDTGENISLDGETSLELLASRLILAENLFVTSENSTEITLSWKAPGDIVVESWDVRCYNDIGYEEKVTVTDNMVTFSGIDPSYSHTIEVTAAGMTQPVRTSITANPITITQLNVDNSKHEHLTLSWDFTGSAPEDGWLVLYSYVGGQKNVVKSTKPTAQIAPQIPGARYEISVQAADGTSLFNNQITYSCPEGSAFSEHNLTAEQLSVDLVSTPPEDRWNFENYGDGLIKTEFAVGDPISLALRSTDNFYLTGAKVDVLYVIRDSYGNILPDLVSEEALTWKNIWHRGDVKIGELNLPAIPGTAGEYELSLYFDGMLVSKLPFTIH